MSLFKKLFLSLLFILILQPGVLCQEDWQIPKGQLVGPGIKKIEVIKPDIPLAAYVLEIDLTHPNLLIETILSNDRLTGNEVVTSMMERKSYKGHQVLAAVNGDFWATEGVPTGLMIRKGQLLRSANQRAALGFTTRKEPIIDFFETRITFKGGGREFVIDELNGYVTQNEPVLFTPERTTLVNPPEGNYAISLAPEIWELHAQDKIQASVLRINDPLNPLKFTDTQFALVTPIEAVSGYPDLFHWGSPVEMEVQTKARFYKEELDLAAAVGGGPWLLKDGETVIDQFQEMRPAFNTTRHPRTAAGYSQDKNTLFLVVVDGRQTGHSIGIDLYDLAKFMKKLGCHEAINLDGGGSSSMAVRGETVNKPSDSSGPRPVCNALAIVSTAPPSQLRRMRIEPLDFELFPEQTIELAVIGEDEYHNPVDLPEEEVQWEVLSGSGRFTGQGLFQAGNREGEVVVGAFFDGVVGTSLSSLSTRALGKVIKAENIRIIPEEIGLSPGEEIPFILEVQDSSGNWHSVSPEIARWRDRRNRAGQFNEDTAVFKATEHGQALIEARYEGHRARARIICGSKETVVLDDFNTTEDWRLTGVNVDMKANRIQTSSEQVVGGTSSLRLDYDLQKGDGTAAVYLNTQKVLPWEPERISFFLYGNGCDHLFRMVIKDVDGEKFYADAPGSITWDNEWKEVNVYFTDLQPLWSNPEGELDPPYLIDQFYIVEPRTAEKDQGTIYLDELTVVYPPRFED
jgi:uncharacterized protein YigE (DUF2233 family)